MALSGPLPRRAVLALLASAAAVAAAPGRAAALTGGEAEDFVRQVVSEVVSLVESGKPLAQQKDGFRALFEKRAAVSSVVRFVMGATWRDMSGAQQSQMQDAFLDYVSRVYAELLSSYKGQSIELGQVQDFGKKGILVASTAKGEGVENVAVEWLVSDRGGQGPQLVDVIIEGLSMLQSQRQEFGAMLEKRGGDVDKLIADLKAG